MVRMIHAVDSLKLLQLLDSLAPRVSDPLGLPSGQYLGRREQARVASGGILADADAIASCCNDPVVGLMTMAAWGTDAETARPSFVRLRQTRDALRQRTGLALPTCRWGCRAISRPRSRKARRSCGWALRF